MQLDGCPGPEIIKDIHDIINAHKYENIKKVSFF